jgi:UPF0271 protein
MVENDAALADALVQAVHDVDASLRVVGFAGGQLCRVADEAGLPISHEAFTDRRYGTDGKLLPRGTDGAVIEDMEAAVAQAVSLAADGRVTDTDGNTIRIPADTLCVHGDRANAAAFAKALHTGLEDAGIEIRTLPRA